MDWTLVLTAAVPAVVALLLAGHAWLKAHAAQTSTKADDYALAALDTIADLAAHNTALAQIVAASPNKLDDAALDLAKQVDAAAKA